MKKEKCCICGELCSGNMRIIARKNKEYIFCTFHFNEYVTKPLGEVRKQIKFNKRLIE
jgi:hypothetical protein